MFSLFSRDIFDIARKTSLKVGSCVDCSPELSSPPRRLPIRSIFWRRYAVSLVSVRAHDYNHTARSTKQQHTENTIHHILYSPQVVNFNATSFYPSFCENVAQKINKLVIMK